MLRPVYIFQVDGNGVFAGFSVIHITGSVRCQISMTTLIVVYLGFAHIKPNIDLHEQKCLVII